MTSGQKMTLGAINDIVAENDIGAENNTTLLFSDTGAENGICWEARTKKRINVQGIFISPGHFHITRALSYHQGTFDSTYINDTSHQDVRRNK